MRSSSTGVVDKRDRSKSTIRNAHGPDQALRSEGWSLFITSTYLAGIGCPLRCLHLEIWPEFGVWQPYHLYSLRMRTE